jgi:hypothetical protein
MPLKSEKGFDVAITQKEFDEAIEKMVAVLQTGRTSGVQDIYDSILNRCDSIVQAAIYGDAAACVLQQFSFATSERYKRTYLISSFVTMERKFTRADLEQVVAKLPPVLERVCPGSKSYVVEAAKLLLQFKFGAEVV